MRKGSNHHYCGSTVGSYESLGQSTLYQSILTELNTTRQQPGFVVRRKLSSFGHTIRDGGCELVKCRVLEKVHGKDGVEDLIHRTVATSQTGRVEVWKKSHGIGARLRQLVTGARLAADWHS